MSSKNGKRRALANLGKGRARVANKKASSARGRSRAPLICDSCVRCEFIEFLACYLLDRAQLYTRDDALDVDLRETLRARRPDEDLKSIVDAVYIKTGTISFDTAFESTGFEFMRDAFAKYVDKNVLRKPVVNSEYIQTLYDQVALACTMPDEVQSRDGHGFRTQQRSFMYCRQYTKEVFAWRLSVSDKKKLTEKDVQKIFPKIPYLHRITLAQMTCAEAKDMKRVLVREEAISSLTEKFVQNKISEDKFNEMRSRLLTFNRDDEHTDHVIRYTFTSPQEHHIHKALADTAFSINASLLHVNHLIQAWSDLIQTRLPSLVNAVVRSTREPEKYQDAHLALLCGDEDPRLLERESMSVIAALAMCTKELSPLPFFVTQASRFSLFEKMVYVDQKHSEKEENDESEYEYEEEEEEDEEYEEDEDDESADYEYKLFMDEYEEASMDDHSDDLLDFDREVKELLDVTVVRDEEDWMLSEKELKKKYRAKYKESVCADPDYKMLHSIPRAIRRRVEAKRCRCAHNVEAEISLLNAMRYLAITLDAIYMQVTEAAAHAHQIFGLMPFYPLGNGSLARYFANLYFGLCRLPPFVYDKKKLGNAYCSAYGVASSYAMQQDSTTAFASFMIDAVHDSIMKQQTTIEKYLSRTMKHAHDRGFCTENNNCLPLEAMHHLHAVWAHCETRGRDSDVLQMHGISFGIKISDVLSRQCGVVNFTHGCDLHDHSKVLNKSLFRNLLLNHAEKVVGKTQSKQENGLVSRTLPAKGKGSRQKAQNNRKK